jgi:enoyl-CoA hydratase/carnithine racemase
MFFSIFRRSAIVMTLVMPMLLAACATSHKPPAEAVAVPAVPPSHPPVTPVEAEPIAPATQPGGIFTPLAPGPVGAMLAYADKVRPLGAPELANELARLGDLVETPTTQMQTAIVLAQTRVPADLAKAFGLMQRVTTNPSAEAQPLQPLARTLAARYAEQRRVEDDRDRQAQQVRDSQRRIDQLNDRIEALRAIERSFARPNAPPAAAPAITPKPAP